MRLIRNPQTTFVFQHTSTTAKAQWQKISDILDANPRIAQWVWRDLNQTKNGKPKRPGGARGMTAEQVLRFALVKMRLELSYRALADRVDDSIVLREFCRMPYEKVPVFTTLQENIKRLQPDTLREINAAVIRYAVEMNVEDGRRIRIDSTAVESNIHHPADSAQLWDCVRVLTRILRRVETEFERLRGRFGDHTRVAKRLRYKLSNTRGQHNRRPLYKSLIETAKKTATYAQLAIAELAPDRFETFDERLVAGELRNELEQFTPLAQRVIEQSTRRVLNGEPVPPDEKVLSIFEPHTDIIVKGQRENVYGHKIFLAAGKSNLILDCAVEKGNPSDSGQFGPALERCLQQFANAPSDVAADGGFASKHNAALASEIGVKNVAFSVLKGNTLAELVQSARVYKQLRKWRAGIEGIISAAKRAFGLDRCTWRGYASFQAYVHLAVLAFNLQTLARHLL
jgi:IS5 family transposase